MVKWYTGRRCTAMLKELYHGKISPSEKKPGHADSCTQEWMKLSAEFEKTLTPEQV
jgi:hypothetical protein